MWRTVAPNSLSILSNVTTFVSSTVSCNKPAAIDSQSNSYNIVKSQLKFDNRSNAAIKLQMVKTPSQSEECFESAKLTSSPSIRATSTG